MIIVASSWLFILLHYENVYCTFRVLQFNLSDCNQAKPIIKRRAISQSIKTRLYKTILRPAVTYGAEIWTLTRTTEKTLMTWEREGEILRTIYGPIKEKGQWRNKTNEELRTKHKSQQTATAIKI
jgi:hypothetical protein